MPLPTQKLVGPAGVTTGGTTGGNSTTPMGAETGEMHPAALVTVAVNTPVAETVMLDEVAPFDHKMLPGAFMVRTTLPPSQNVSVPLATGIGVGGFAFTVTVTGSDTGLTQPLASVMKTVMVSDCVIVMVLLLSPLLQLYPTAATVLNTTWLPSQKTNGPLAEMTGWAGNGLTVSPKGVEGDEVHPFPSVTVTT